MGVLSEALNEYANSADWCTTYDRWMADLSAQLLVPFTPRTIAVEHCIQGTAIGSFDDIVEIEVPIAFMDDQKAILDHIMEMRDQSGLPELELTNLELDNYEIV